MGFLKRRGPVLELAVRNVPLFVCWSLLSLEKNHSQSINNDRICHFLKNEKDIWTFEAISGKENIWGSLNMDAENADNFGENFNEGSELSYRLTHIVDLPLSLQKL